MPKYIFVYNSFPCLSDLEMSATHTHTHMYLCMCIQSASVLCRLSLIEDGSAFYSVICIAVITHAMQGLLCKREFIKSLLIFWPQATPTLVCFLESWRNRSQEWPLSARSLRAQFGNFANCSQMESQLD